MFIYVNRLCKNVHTLLIKMQNGMHLAENIFFGAFKSI